VPTVEETLAALDGRLTLVEGRVAVLVEKMRTLRNRVASIVVCPECGQPISTGSCGPTHAEKAARLDQHFSPPVIEG
jgi:hypothetical protein